MTRKRFWQRRSTKAVVGVLTLGLLGWFGVNFGPPLVVDTYDMVTFGMCQTTVKDAYAWYYDYPEAPADMAITDKFGYYATLDRQFRAKVADAWCPSFVQDERTAFLEQWDKRIAMYEGLAKGDKPNYVYALNLRTSVGEAYRAFTTALQIGVGPNEAE